jgi:hypothetical protein
MLFRYGARWGVQCRFAAQPHQWLWPYGWPYCVYTWQGSAICASLLFTDYAWSCDTLNGHLWYDLMQWRGVRLR